MNRSIALKVAAVEAETEHAVSIHLRQPLLRRLKYSAGQYLMLDVDVGDGKSECRAYSISSTPGLERTLSITVKKLAGGHVSNWLAERLGTGMSVRTFGVRGRCTFTPQDGASRHIVLFAAGSGIVPQFSILKSVLHFEPQSRVSLIYGNRTLDAAIFRDKIERLRQTFGDRLRVIHALSRPEPPQPEQGRLSRERALGMLRDLAVQPGTATQFYVCGPSGMMEEVTAALSELGVPADSVHLESFAPARPRSATRPEEAQVRLFMQDKAFDFRVPSGKTILEAALASGIQPPFSCRSGFCTACVCTRVSGEVEMPEEHGLSESELEMGQALLCVGYPASHEVQLRIE